MNNWFVVEYLIRQQQMEQDREAGEAWKYWHDLGECMEPSLPGEEKAISTYQEAGRVQPKG